MHGRNTAWVLGLAALATACGGGTNSGSILALTYNVAGLPQGLSSSNPEVNTVQISPLLNDYELVLVQEDFTYHDALISEVELPYISTPKEPDSGGLVNDGLNRMGVFPLGDLYRERWTSCFGTFDNGSDCLAEKGFSVSTIEVAKNTFVDVYNFHMDAGNNQEDIDARDAQITQMLATILTRSEGRALILGGDTNLNTDDRPIDETNFQRLLSEAGLRDACRELACGDEHRIDRFMLRDGTDIALRPSVWFLDERMFTDTGEPLSDHEAVATGFDWERL